MKIARLNPNAKDLKALEEKQAYRGMTFTDFGRLVLDVSAMENGRISLKQEGKELKLLPETLSGLDTSVKDGSIPRPTPHEEPWTISTFSPKDSETDDLNVFLDEKGQNLEIQDQQTGISVTVQTEHLYKVVAVVVDPWLAMQPKEAGLAIDYYRANRYNRIKGPQTPPQNKASTESRLQPYLRPVLAPSTSGRCLLSIGLRNQFDVELGLCVLRWFFGRSSYSFCGRRLAGR